MNNPNNITFSIIISALGQNLHCTKKWLSKNIVNHINEVIIVVQLAEKFNSEIEYFRQIGCKVIVDKCIGLSHSRNLGIANCSSDFFWILDDDVYTDLDMIETIIKSINNEKSDIYCFRIAKDYNNTLYKKYLNIKNINKLNILRVSSIEIVISRKIVNKNSIVFNENFGLGSKYPSCEENLFLLECFNKGLKIIHIPKVVVIHENISSGYVNLNLNALIAKGYICQKYGFIGFFIILKWYLRILFQYRRISAIKYFIKGYRLENI